MPSFIRQIPDLAPNGPVVPVKIGLPKTFREFLTQQKKSIIGPIQINALIDTGASMTYISPKVSQQLKLIPRGITNAFTAGQPTPANIYMMCI